MTPDKRQFLVSRRHRIISRLWQSFFAGWGLLLTIVLIASPFVVQNIAWSVLDAIDVDSLRQNNLNVNNLILNGVDKNGEPFEVSAASAVQKYSDRDTIYFTSPVADVARIMNGRIIRDNITADSGRFLKDQHKIILTGNVRVKSDDGSTASAKEMEIDLR